MATRKRAATDPASPPPVEEAQLSAGSIAEFMGAPGKPQDLERALELARNAAQRALGQPIPEQIPFPLAQGIKLLASKLLLSNRLEDEVAPADIPLVVRYYFRLAGAQG